MTSAPLVVVEEEDEDSGEVSDTEKSASEPRMESIPEQDEEKEYKKAQTLTQDNKQLPQETAVSPTPAAAADDATSEFVHPRSFWLSAFFFPQGFLTAVMQMHARKTAVSVDSLTLDFSIVRTGHTDDFLNDLKQRLDVRRLAFEGMTPPEDGVLVFGLFLDGARWDTEKHALGNSLPGQRFSRLPEMHFLPVQTVCN